MNLTLHIPTRATKVASYGQTCQVINLLVPFLSWKHPSRSPLSFYYSLNLISRSVSQLSFCNFPSPSSWKFPLLLSCFGSPIFWSSLLLLSFSLKKIFIYLAALDLSCSLQDLCCSPWTVYLWCMGAVAP